MKKNQEAIKQVIATKRWLNEISRKSLDYSAYRPRKRSQAKKKIEYIKFPVHIDIYSTDHYSYKETVNIITAIGRVKQSPVKTVHLDFSNTESIKAAAILILYATIEQCINQGINFRIISFPKNNLATKIIKKSGLDTLCKENIHSPNFGGDVISVVSGCGGSYRDEIVDFIQQKIYKNKMSLKTESIYGGAIQEAINNVNYHAYPEIDDTSSEDKKWWLKCDLAGDQLFLAIYDKGVGIPETVMKRGWYEKTLRLKYPELFKKIREELRKDGIKYNSLIESASDAKKIAISMIGDVTGTEESKHGQGSKSIKALVTENEYGMLWIYSNHGLYKLDSAKVSTHDLPRPISGTLIQWNIKVDLDER